MPTEKATQYANDPKGNAQRWQFEFNAARERIKLWHEKAEKVVNRYLDRQKGKTTNRRGRRRLNLFTSNIQTLQALLYGKTPQVDVTRKWGDPDDELARVAAEMMQRSLNTSIEKDSDTYAHVVELCLEDRLLPGLAMAKCRYVAEFDDPEEDAPPEQEAQVGPDGAELAPAVPAVPKKTYECVEVDYIPWKKQLWSQVETFLDMRWWAFQTDLSREGLVDMFGEEVGNKLPLNLKQGTRRKSDEDDRAESPWARAALWEVWDKEGECLWYVIEGWNETLVPLRSQEDANEDGSVKDTLGLEGFWPFPRPMIANSTTSGFMPEPDYAIGQDLYEQIDDLETRIYIIQKAIRVRYLYNGQEEGLARLTEEGGDNDGIPLNNWLAFMDKGGIQQAVQFMSLDMLLQALTALQGVQDKKVEQLYQVTGMSDIMRGQSSTQTTATEQRIKGAFASARVQKFQDEFARFCSDIQRIKAEIISLHFDPETIIEESNIEHTPDAQYAQQAVRLIKSNFYQFRVQVKPESVSLTDFAQMKSERQDFIAGLANFLTSAAPAAQGMPGSAPYLLKLLGWYMAGFRGSGEAQGIIDQAVAAAEKMLAQAPPPGQGAPPPPDPKLIANQQKAQADMAKIQAESQAEIQRMQAETQQLEQRKATDAVINVKEAAAKQAIVRGGLGPTPTPGGVPA